MKRSDDDDDDVDTEYGDGRRKREPILMLHGRTWSSVPVYHLLGGKSEGAESTVRRRNEEEEDDDDDEEEEGKKEREERPRRENTNQRRRRRRSSESRSLMERLYDAGLEPYCMDFRGFGGTPPDRTGRVTPDVCVRDVEAVLSFVAERHRAKAAAARAGAEEGGGGGRRGDDEDEDLLPSLLGWSQGALVAQLTAQKQQRNADASSASASPPLLSKLILYGSIYDPSIVYPRPPLYPKPLPLSSSYSSSPADNDDDDSVVVLNDYEGAVEDFTIEGSISSNDVRSFAESSLIVDPEKAEWTSLHQFNECDPSRLRSVPALLIGGDSDPYAPVRVQSEMFRGLADGIGGGGGNDGDGKVGADRSWTVLSGCDHAVHLLEENGGGDRFVRAVKNFLSNSD